MKNIYPLLLGLLTAGMLCIPALALTEGPAAQEPPAPVQTERFRVLEHETGKVTSYDADDYLFGVLAAEMPASYPEEALKAQAVAAYTFALYRKAENAGREYDISTDSRTDQAFLPRAEARKRWGDQAEEYTEKLDRVLAAVRGYAVTWEDRPILAAYHAISGGKTESAKVMWGSEIAYLQPVESIGDLLAPDYLSELSLPPAEFAEKLGALGVTFDGEESDYVGAVERSESGTVLSVKLCGQAVTGEQIRSCLSLRSSNFELAYADGAYRFTVHGSGHGVGMSQYGASYLARQGSTYVEILSWYYPGCRMQKLSRTVG